MLILSRREGESIMIGDLIEVVVSRIDHDSVKIGVVAPRNMAVFRREIYRKIQESNLISVRDGQGGMPEIALPERLKGKGGAKGFVEGPPGLASGAEASPESRASENA